MIRWLLPLAAFLFTLAPGGSGDVIDPLDELRFRAPKEKGRAELVEGRDGKAIRLTFDAEHRGVFFTSSLRGTPEWDQADGFSFWVKGDGSDSFGGLELIYDDDYAVRYDYAFPVRGTQWQKVTVAWNDLIPVLPGPRARPLIPRSGNSPSKVSAFWFGKWWYWGDYPAHSFTVDDLRLEREIPRNTRDYTPKGPPLARTLRRLKAGQPVTVVTMGDSLTDFRHWANRSVSWPVLLRDRIKAKYGSEVRLENPAIGGTQLRQNLVLIPRWTQRVREPDLVTVCFGYNDWEAGMRGGMFHEAYVDAIDRIRRATQGKADVLVLTTLPAADRWETMTELARDCRTAAATRNAGLADTEKTFLDAGKTDRERLYVSDRTHLSPQGHELIARTVMEAVDRAGR